ncbi:hypothetical protein INT45_002891 [Circinella minor]|uniref:Uncharacterized protein n=1 Tax=Circinella minor TaxID=1195481 RepID=A0A8H7S875_9FUNG|nr:hypothetical protein INT45_002891 [Circinella minor]
MHTTMTISSMNAEDGNIDHQESDTNTDLYITERTPESDFTPYSVFREALQGRFRKRLRYLLPKADYQPFVI